MKGPDPCVSQSRMPCWGIKEIELFIIHGSNWHRGQMPLDTQYSYAAGEGGIYTGFRCARSL